MAEPNAEDRASAVVALLTAESSALRREGAAIVVAFALERPLRELVDPAEAAGLLADALTEEALTRVHDRHVEPAWERHLARTAASGERVGDAVPEPVRQELEAIVGELRRPPAAWADGLVDPALLRELVAPVMQTTLLTFARRLPMVGLGASEDSMLGGLAGRLAKSVEKRAEKIADAGRKAMGGLGAELDARLQRTAKEFSREALESLRDALGERLRSEEGRELARRIRTQAFERFLDAEVAELMRDADATSRARLSALLPRLVAHNALRAPVREAVREELEAFLQVEGDRSLGALLDDAGLRDRVTELAVARVDGHMRTLLSGDEAVDWIARVLAAADR